MNKNNVSKYKKKKLEFFFSTVGLNNVFLFVIQVTPVRTMNYSFLQSYLLGKKTEPSSLSTPHFPVLTCRRSTSHAHVLGTPSAACCRLVTVDPQFTGDVSRVIISPR